MLRRRGCDGLGAVKLGYTADAVEVDGNLALTNAGFDLDGIAGLAATIAPYAKAALRVYDASAVDFAPALIRAVLGIVGARRTGRGGNLS